MNKKTLTLSILFALIFCTVFSACSKEGTDTPDNPPAATSSYDLLIKELEEKILELQQNQYISEAESQKLIEELQDEIEKLRAQSSTTSTTAATSTTLPSSVFIYSVENEKAIITGFTGNDEHMVIPSQIDGFDVYGIASNAFEKYSFKSVIISEGVEHIDWFAFYGCSNLTSITIPSSVKRIGYSAFDGCAKKFTIYCHSGSFAQSYAQSYGIAYAII